MIAIDSITKINTAVVYAVSQSELGPGVLGLLAGADPIGLSQIIDVPEPRQSSDGIVLSSMRNQLIVTIAASKLQFDDRSSEEPVRHDFASRVVSAAEYIGSLSTMTYTAVGLNFDIESKSASEELPSQAVLARLFKDDVFTGTEFNAMGAAARLWYTASNRMYDLRIEPRGNQFDGNNYFAHLNAHIVLEGEMLSAQRLSRALDEEYDGFKRVLMEVLNEKERSRQ